MAESVMQQLERFGPDRCGVMSEAEARQWCRRLAGGHYENFSVLSRLVPSHLRDDFAAVYAFCRWADDLGDEAGDPARSLELLTWWREELNLCMAGEPRHPVFVALRPTITRHDLPVDPFDHLIRAFEQDQKISRYETWEELIGYCRLSADPVGRLVLMLLGEPREERFFTPSDAICTALQLTNHWQDLKRDLLCRNRLYIPHEFIGIKDFEVRFKKAAIQGYAPDQTFLSEARTLIKGCVERTWALFEQGESLLGLVQPTNRPIIWLFVAGGEHVLRQVEMWNYETVLHRPRLGAARKLQLVARAWLMSKLSRSPGSPRRRP